MKIVSLIFKNLIVTTLVFGTLAQADDPPEHLLGSFEIAVQPKEVAEAMDVSKWMAQGLSKVNAIFQSKTEAGNILGKSIPDYFSNLLEKMEPRFLIFNSPEGRPVVQDKTTHAVFLINIDAGSDAPVIEIQTPPLFFWQIEEAYRPLYEATHGLGWVHRYGGGHLNIDLETLERDPIRFLNFLIFLHNNPISQRLFAPVNEKTPTLFETGLQAELLKLVEFCMSQSPLSSRKILEAIRLFFSNLNGLHKTALGMRLKAYALELRFINAQLSEQEAALQLEFYDKIWMSLRSDAILKPVEWDLFAYNEHMTRQQGETTTGAAKNATDLISSLGLTPKRYSQSKEFATERMILKSATADRIWQEKTGLPQLWRVTQPEQMSPAFFPPRNRLYRFASSAELPAALRVVEGYERLRANEPFVIEEHYSPVQLERTAPKTDLPSNQYFPKSYLDYMKMYAAIFRQGARPKTGVQIPPRGEILKYLKPIVTESDQFFQCLSLF